MIPQTLLTSTESRAPGICIYGGPGLKKTNAIHTLPAPIMLFDFEQGTGSILPWIRRKRAYDSTEWITYTDEQRQAWFNLLTEKVRREVKIRPAPLIDVVSYNVTEYESYTHFVGDLGSFNVKEYNSLAVDSLQELTADVQTFSRGQGGYDKLMNEVAHSWIQAQERSQKALRRLRDYRDQGVFVYLTGSEDISKDYVRDPLSTKKGQAVQEPYNVRGTVNLPGKLAEALTHLPDILMHARMINGSICWVTKTEPIGGGDAFWDAKDRFGRLDEYISPSIRDIAVKLYGEETASAIYKAGSNR